VDGVLVRGLRDHRRGRRPNTLSVLLAVVDPRLQGRGLSAEVLTAMILIASIWGMRALVAPVRPTLKHRYPLVPMERYVRWRRTDRAPFDPWLRVHWRLGARVLGSPPARWWSRAASSNGKHGPACASRPAASRSCPARCPRCRSIEA
jgi:hypothetical protein